MGIKVLGHKCGKCGGDLYITKESTAKFALGVIVFSTFLIPLGIGVILILAALPILFGSRCRITCMSCGASDIGPMKIYDKVVLENQHIINNEKNKENK